MKDHAGFKPLPKHSSRSAVFAFCVSVSAFGSSLPAESKSQIVTFDPPGSTLTYAFGINTRSEIAGTYVDSTGAHRCYWRVPDGTIIKFDPSASVDCVANGIDDHGNIAGYYHDSDGDQHGFVRSADGTIVSFDGLPGSASTTSGKINKGVVTGFVTDCQSGCADTAFVRDGNGNITTFDVRRHLA